MLYRTNLNVGAETINPSNEHERNKTDVIAVTDLRKYKCTQYKSRLCGKVKNRPEVQGTVPKIRVMSQTNVGPFFISLILFRLPYKNLQNGDVLGYCQRLP